VAQKWLKNGSKMGQKGVILDPKMGHFGAIFEPLLSQNWNPKTAGG
jgi:hypothetical protein